jgi:hypothetical protein
MNRRVARLARYCAVWVVLAAVATGISWAAIQSLLTSVALGQPVHAAVLGQGAIGPAATTAVAVPPSAPTGSVVAVRPRTPATKRITPSATATPTATSTVTPTATPATTRGYALTGGQVVLEEDAGSARLVSAVPAAGYRAQVARTQYWIRVDFIAADHSSTLIVTWYQHAPAVQTSED